MDKETLEKLIKIPAEISGEDAQSLEELAQAFPYCQVAYLLLAKESQQKKSMHYPKRLQKASTYTLDRKVLHKILNPINYAPAVRPATFTKVVHPATAPAGVETNKILEELEENLKLLKQHKENQSLSNGKKEDREIRPENKPSNNLPIPERKEPTLHVDNSFKTESKLGDEIVQTPETDQTVDALLTYLEKANSWKREPKILSTEEQAKIIEEFIQKDPQIPKSTVALPAETSPQDLSQKSTELKIDLVTENYAQILTKQNKIDKAKEVYKKLILKYPDKSAYFAAKLNELETR